MRFPSVVAFALAASSVGCGDNVRIADPSAPAGPSPPPSPGIAAELIARAGPLRRDLYAGYYPPGVAVGMDRNGHGWAIWTRMSPPRVEAARFDGGRWMPPITLHDATLPLDGRPGRDATGAALAVNEAGHAVAGWTEEHGDGHWITMASSWNGSAWDGAVRVQDTPTGSYATRGRGLGIPGAPALSLDRAGNAWIVWFRAPSASYPSTRPATLVGSHRRIGGAWASEDTVADAYIYSNGSFGIAPLPDAEALVVWAHDHVLRSARVSPSRQWRWGIITEAASRISGPVVEPLPRQGALIGWTGTAASGTPPAGDGLKVVPVGSDLGIEAPVVVAAEGRGPPAIAVSPAGHIVIAWVTATAVWARWAESWSVPLGPPVAVADGLIDPVGLALAADPAGNAIALWLDRAGGTRVAAARLLAGRWTAATTVHQATQAESFTGPRVAMDGAGNAIAAFSVTAARSSGPPTEVEVRAVRIAAVR